MSNKLKSKISIQLISSSKNHPVDRFSENVEKVKLRANRPKPAESAKRYTYAGPPSISLGSWSERPSVNVQIKNDTDYKLGSKADNTSGSRTVVSLNGNRRTDEESRVDTSSVKFSELARTFESNVNVDSAKLRRASAQPIVRVNPQVIRQFEHIPEKRLLAASASVPTNGSSSNNINNNNVRNQLNPAKRYTSVVGINGNNEEPRVVSNNYSSGNHAPLAKSYSSSADSRQQVPTAENEFKVPKPPTLPVITGVTLKSANARSVKQIPIQVDPRDQLLDSIKNFGGLANLKKVL